MEFTNLVTAHSYNKMDLDRVEEQTLGYTYGAEGGDEEED